MNGKKMTEELIVFVGTPQTHIVQNIYVTEAITRSVIYYKVTAKYNLCRRWKESLLIEKNFDNFQSIALVTITELT